MDTWLSFESITVAGPDFRQLATISIGLNPNSNNFGSDGSPFSVPQLTAFHDGPFNTELKWVDLAGLPDADIPTNAFTPVLASNSVNNAETELNVGHIETPAVNTSELITAVGNPSLQFNDNAIPSYTSGSGALTFTNTVQLSGTAGIADLNGLVFTPTDHQVASGSTVTTGFTLALADTAGQTSSETATSVVATAVAVPPTITSTAANQMVNDTAVQSAHVSEAGASAFGIQGVTAQSYSPTYYSSAPFVALLNEAATDGANSVVLASDPVINPSTGVISDYITNGYDVTPPLSSIGPAIVAAEAQGLSVMLKPIVGMVEADGSFDTLLDHSSADPTVLPNPAAFFASYKSYILQWAELAQQYNVPILSIGTEMGIATQPQYTSYWVDIIDSIRDVYHGALTYSAYLGTPSTTGGIDNEVQQIQFWNNLDYVGMDVYPDLTNQVAPTVSQLNADWHQTTVGGQSVSYTQYIDQLATQIGKPVLFTETGVNSYAGADADGGSLAKVGLPGTQTDWTSQEIWWQSFFDTWAANKPSWLAGLFAFEFNVPESQPSYANNLDINGKPAEMVLSSWYGGNDYLSSSQLSFTGSVANDQIYLYGNQISNALQSHGNSVTQAETFNTTISLTVEGTIINGHVPTIHVYVNGIDEGSQTLANTPSNYVDSKGVTWTQTQTFTYTLPELANVSQIKLVIDSAVNVGGPENEQTYINGIDINGVSLTNGTYFPLVGSPELQTLGNGSSNSYDGGYTIIDASPWNSALANRQIGSAADPIQVEGGGGTDTVNVLGLPSEYTVNGIGTSTVTLSENAGLDQNAVLSDISYVSFQDGSVLNLANGTWSAGSQPLTYVPTVAVEASMYGAVGSSAVITSLVTNFLPGQLAYANQVGLDPGVFACLETALVFAFSNETGATTFANNFGPSNAAMPATAAGDAAFAAAATNAIFGSAQTANTAPALLGYVHFLEGFFTANGIVGVQNPTPDQIVIAARAGAWGEGIAIALENNLGSLPGQVNNFLNDASVGTAIYFAPLTSQPTFHGVATASAATTASHVQVTGLAAPVDHAVM